MMQTECEVKFTGINPVEVSAKLLAQGGVLEHAEYLMRVTVFDYPDFKLDQQQKAWLRLRDEGHKVTLTYKQFDAYSTDDVQEIGIVVDDFDQTDHLLLSLGFIHKSSQEKKREIWRLGDCEVVIDTWPWIPPFIEIEGPSVEVVHAAAEQLGYDMEQAMYAGVSAIYRLYFDVPREKIDYCRELYFGETPDWLEATRRKIALTPKQFAASLKTI